MYDDYVIYIYIEREREGERYYTRTRKSEVALENATESPLDVSSNHPLGK